MVLISCSDRTSVLLRNQYPLYWLPPEFLIVLFHFVSDYNESVE
jgi:hypothetical protein